MVSKVLSAFSCLRTHQNHPSRRPLTLLSSSPLLSPSTPPQSCIGLLDVCFQNAIHSSRGLFLFHSSDCAKRYCNYPSMHVRAHLRLTACISHQPPRSAKEFDMTASPIIPRDLPREIPHSTLITIGCEASKEHERPYLSLNV